MAYNSATHAGESGEKTGVKMTIDSVSDSKYVEISTEPGIQKSLLVPALRRWEKSVGDWKFKEANDDICCSTPQSSNQLPRISATTISGPFWTQISYLHLSLTGFTRSTID